MSVEQEYKQANIAIDPVSYYLLWLKVTLLKIFSFGLYAPWAKQELNRYLLSNTHFSNRNFILSPHASDVFKTRVIFFSVLLFSIILMQVLPVLSWAFQLVVLISVPGFYLIEKKYELNAISLGSDEVRFEISLIEFYKSVALPILLFIFSAVVISNNEIIDSRFLASIDTKDTPAIYAEDSYLMQAEKEFKTAAHSSEHALDHTDEHADEMVPWNENISKEEIEYLGEHEKSHNHGSIALSSLQKYQVANQGNQFIQTVLIVIILAFIWPWLDYKIMAYRITHTNFLGSRDWNMKLGVASLYRLYVKTFLVVLFLVAFIGLMLAILLTGSEGTSPEFWSNLLANSLWLLPLGLAVLLFAFNLLFTWRKQWLLSSLVSSDADIHSESLYLETLLLSATNTLLLFFTLGLAWPWCHLRTTRYLTNHFNVRA
jgi:uncharacterized membrane protein YjgN (DUF898 family)